MPKGKCKLHNSEQTETNIAAARPHSQILGAPRVESPGSQIEMQRLLPYFPLVSFCIMFCLMRTFSMLAIGFKLIANVPFGMKVMSCEPSFGESFYSNAAIDEM